MSAGDPEEQVGGILLAAGTGSRFGEKNKLLVRIDGTPLVRLAAESLVASKVDPVVVVVGFQADRVRAALEGLTVEIVHNPDFRDGQATSVRTAVNAIRGRVDAAVFALGDMPFVEPQSIDALVSAYRAGEGDALAAAYDGERGNPALLDRSHFDALVNLEGDIGGREILKASGTLIETGDPGVRRDIDRPDDLPE